MGCVVFWTRGAPWARGVLGAWRARGQLTAGAWVWARTGAGPVEPRTTSSGSKSSSSGFATTCVANLSGSPIGLPPHAEALLASGPLTGGQLPPDTTVWLRAGS
jgi:hypothetical protein